MEVKKIIKIIPAIDLMDKKVVRLYKGEKGNVKTYGDPIEIAKKFAKYVDLIHIVDLDGAFEGVPKNLDIVREIIKETGMKVEVGGGFRTFESIKKANEMGAEYIIVGTAAFDLEFLKEITGSFSNITISLDAKNGLLKTQGWLVEEKVVVKKAFDIFKNYTNRFVYTDTSKDGTLEGISPNIEKFWDNEEIIYAGGVTSVEDLKGLESLGFKGAIIGKAIYEGKINLEELVGE
nr:1-(5-phosphoribosyl)-5-((5-phosphoribosylamino)methylideneamino)imidazole-4-carboxamide isomerase [Petrotoga sp. 9PW.55.5.1]